VNDVRLTAAIARRGSGITAARSDAHLWRSVAVRGGTLEVQVGAGPSLMVSVSVRRGGLSGTIVTCGAGNGAGWTV